MRKLKSPRCTGLSLAEIIFSMKRYTEKAYTPVSDKPNRHLIIVCEYLCDKFQSLPALILYKGKESIMFFKG